jgi:hypothetical protein
MGHNLPIQYHKNHQDRNMMGWLLYLIHCRMYNSTNLTNIWNIYMNIEHSFHYLGHNIHQGSLLLIFLIKIIIYFTCNQELRYCFCSDPYMRYNLMRGPHMFGNSGYRFDIYQRSQRDNNHPNRNRGVGCFYGTGMFNRRDNFLLSINKFYI